jgi:hypothetical protein
MTRWSAEAGHLLLPCHRFKAYSVELPATELPWTHEHLQTSRSDVCTTRDFQGSPGTSDLAGVRDEGEKGSGAAAARRVIELVAQDSLSDPAAFQVVLKRY